ncbi:LacI family DNA-binding transcriptional regulator [Pelagicoccus mobilis]|uniref:LacI family DNA-binding transcriptional regulator n=1 Tax=Pelagicoccus mobilis TaxID=415221 RepID=A0A934S0U7_9BACT|nr:LacI family DNA-binding transcriptional regulator [Pelagicoccus mobilis]MBK1879853.1 LacI family DNA-binding transcriptional regulator [Pelagicoccus mobilis]
MARKPNPTLQTIADKCGVTKTTVSLALRNHPRISEKTRAIIKEAAAEIGYKMSPLVSAHMSMIRATQTPQYRATVAIVTDWPTHIFHDKHEMYGRFYTGIERRAQELGFEVDIFSLEEKGMSGKRISQIIETRGINGVIIPPITSDKGSLDLDWDKLAAVTIGYSMREPLIHRICHDNYSTMRRLMKMLSGQGFKRIGIALEFKDDLRVKNLWSGGYLSHVVFDDELAGPLMFVSEDWNQESFGEWLKKDRPDVVIGVSDTILGWAKNLGYSIPDDLSIITVAKRGEEMSGFYQNFELIGEAALEKLVSLVNQNRSGIPNNPQLTLVQGEWQPGNSLKPPGQ